MAYMDVPPLGPPNGHTVVLFHGNNFAGFYFGTSIEALRKEGFRVIVPDQIGYGRSSKPIIPYNFHDMARNTRAILQSLKIERAMVVGHSMGGMLAARFATQYPAVTERLVLYNPIGLVDGASSGPWAAPTSSTSARWRDLPEDSRRHHALRRAQPGGLDAGVRERTRASATPGRSAPTGRAWRWCRR